MSRSVTSRLAEFLDWLRSLWDEEDEPEPTKRHAVSVSCYLRRGVVYIPTFGRDEFGRRQMIEPVAAVPLRDADALHQAIKAAILRGTPSLPFLDRRQSLAALPRLPAIAGTGSWSMFYLGVSIWNIEERGDCYEIIPKRLDDASRGWVLDEEHGVALPPGADLDAVCERMCELLKTAPPPEGVREQSWADDADSDPARDLELQAALDEQPWASLPPGPRDDELGDLLEWIANATSDDVSAIRGEIKRHYYDSGDTEGGDALHLALAEALTATSLTERSEILDRYELYTREPRLVPFWMKGRSFEGKVD